ncbi:MAG TPA: DUF11 domain-containing protein, partial [Verrucomicrobiae bacterium]
TGTNGARITATLLLSDGPVSLGAVTFTYFLGRADIAFANANLIAINDSGPATPYPSVINVTGLSGNITKVTVTIEALNHSFPADIDMALVGPFGQTVMLMSDTGGGDDISNVTLVFDDASPNVLTTTTITNGTYRPTNIGLADARFPDPAPPGPYGSALSVFNDANPNGVWSLYVVDDDVLDGGSIVGGWSLTLSTTAPIGAAVDLSVTASNSGDQPAPGTNVTFTITVTNHGPSMATGVKLTNTLPAGVILGPVRLTPPGTTILVAGQVICTFTNLALGSNATVTIELTPTNIGSFMLDSRVGANEVDPNPANNTAFSATLVGTAQRPNLGGANVMLNSQFQLIISGQPGQTYVIEASADLTPLSWSRISTNTLNSGALNFIDVHAPGFRHRFYRAVRLP